MRNESLKVLIADDHPVVLVGLAQFLRWNQINVVAVADSVGALFESLLQHEIDVVVTDYCFDSVGDGMRLVKRLRRLHPGIKIVVFSQIRPVGVVSQLMASGADAFVGKSAGLQAVLAACNAVADGMKFVDPATQAVLQATAYVGKSSNVNANDKTGDRLSVREREVIRLLAQGMNIREIALRFQRSPKTISAQKCAAMSKLGLRSDIELAIHLARFEA